jgi:hypothetical protein
MQKIQKGDQQCWLTTETVISKLFYFDLQRFVLKHSRDGERGRVSAELSQSRVRPNRPVSNFLLYQVGLFLSTCAIFCPGCNTLEGLWHHKVQLSGTYVRYFYPYLLLVSFFLSPSYVSAVQCKKTPYLGQSSAWIQTMLYMTFKKHSSSINILTLPSFTLSKVWCAFWSWTTHSVMQEAASFGARALSGGMFRRQYIPQSLNFPANTTT